MTKKEYIPFDGNQLIEKDGLTFDNSEDKISIYGNLDIKRDKQGLNKVQNLLNYLNEINAKLIEENSKGKLTDQLLDKKLTIVQNPF